MCKESVKYMVICLLSVFFQWIVIPETFAQSGDLEIRYAVGEEGVYLYHVENVALGDGFNIYKKNSGDSEFERLNNEPVRGILYPSELPSALGDEYERVRASLNTDDATDTFFTLRSNSILGRLYTFIHPDIADALGRLYIDTNTRIGDTVAYRIEFVDDLGRPTDDVLEEEFTIEKTTAPVPQITDISNDGYAMKIEWTLQPSEHRDDKLIRFEIYQSEKGTDQSYLVNSEIIVRDDVNTEYLYHFDTNRLEREMEYRVAVYDITGRVAAISEIEEYYIEDNIPPAVIENVSAQYVSGEVEISWPVSPEPDIAGYNIYKSTDAAGPYILNNGTMIDPFEPVYTDADVEEGKTYYYKVVAVDRAGNEGPQSAFAMRHISDTTPPPAPTGLEAEYIDDGRVHLTWMTDDRPADFRRYIVLRRQKTAVDSTIFSQLTQEDLRQNTFVDQGVAGRGFKEGVFYEYGVLAADSSRNFSDTTRIQLQIPDLTAPEPPANIWVENYDGIRVDVRWSQSRSGDTETYNIYRQKVDSVLHQIDSVPVQKRSYRDEAVELGAEYRFAISAVDSAGNESDPQLSEMVWVRDYDPPRQVRNVRVSGTDDGVMIEWEPTPAHDLSGYYIYRSNLPTGVFDVLNEEPVTDTMWFDTVVENNFWYRVRAVDISGNESRPSDPVRMR